MSIDIGLYQHRDRVKSVASTQLKRTAQKASDATASTSARATCTKRTSQTQMTPQHAMMQHSVPVSMIAPERDLPPHESRSRARPTVTSHAQPTSCASGYAEVTQRASTAFVAPVRGGGERTSSGSIGAFRRGRAARGVYIHG